MEPLNTFRKTLARLFKEHDRLSAEADEFLGRLERQKRRPLVTKDMGTRIVHKKVASEQTKGLNFILSDATPDRYDDIILTSGWELENFKRNPIALFSHAGSFPIGTWKDVRVEDNALRGTLTLAPKGSSARIDEIRALVDADVLKAVSVGFTPLASEQRKGDTFGRLYTRQDLVECSLCSVPANPNALQISKRLNISDATRDLVFAGRDERPVAPRPADGPLTALTRDFLEVLERTRAQDREEISAAFADWAQGLRKEWRQELANLRKDIEIAALKEKVALLTKGGGIIR